MENKNHSFFIIVQTSFGNQNDTNIRNNELPTPNHSSYSSTSYTSKQAWPNENQHLHSSTLSFPGDETDHSSLRSVYQLTVDPDLSSIEVSKEIEKSSDMESSSRHDNLLVDDCAADDEDALSTIMEANEPDTASPTASLEVSSPRTNDSKQIDNTDLSNNENHKHVSESQSIHSRNSQNTNDNNIVGGQSQYKQQLLANHTNRESHLQASYTVQESCTVEKALENGLPVIDSSDNSNKEHFQHAGYIDVNASQDSEVSGMESEQKTEVLDHFLLRKSTEVIDNFLHRTSVDLPEDGEEKFNYLNDSSMRNDDYTNVEQSQELNGSSMNRSQHHVGLTDTNKSYNANDDSNNIKTSASSWKNEGFPIKNISQSYDAKMKYPYNDTNFKDKQTQSLDMKQMLNLKKDASFITSQKSKDSGITTTTSIAAVSTSVGATTSSSVPSSSYDTLPGKTFTSKSTLSQSYSAPYSTSLLYRSTVGSGRGLSQSFDSGFRKSTPVTVPQQSKVSTVNAVPSSEQRETYFNKVSCEHWPFNKSTDGDIVEKMKDVNGRDIIIERLNILKRSLGNSDDESVQPTLSSWVNESTNKSRASLEEREERLKKVF